MSSYIKFRGALYRCADDYDYRGPSTAPTHEGGSPLWSVSPGSFPEDFYTLDGFKYYRDNLPYDFTSWELIRKLRNKPNNPVKIYRSVPSHDKNKDLIAQYEKDRKYMWRTNEMPPDVYRGKFKYKKDGQDEWSQYYTWLGDQIEELKKLPKPSGPRIQINPGDWVTISRPYAVLHGKSNLHGNFDIVSKTVFARDLWTNGNSLHEWGYDPQPSIG